jgi:hypothetical protein
MKKLSQRPDTGFFGVDGGGFKIGNKTQKVAVCYFLNGPDMSFT